MRLASLVREAIASTLAQLVPALVIAALTLGMCLTTLLTVGRTAAAQEEVQATLEVAGSRMLQISDTGGDELLTPAVVDSVASIGSVERSLARTTARDVQAASVGSGGDPVPLWAVRGELAGAVTLESGRWPRAGEAIVSSAGAGLLGFDGPVGALESAVGREYAVVGTYASRDPFGALDAGAITPAAGTDHLRTLTVVMTSANQVEASQEIVLGIVGAANPADLTVVSPANLAELQAQIAGSLESFGAGLLVLVLGAGGPHTRLVVRAATRGRRKDIGRRRALGATRGDLVMLVTLRTAFPAAAGAVIGTVIGLLVTLRMGATVPPDFIGGTAILALLCAALSAIAPAVVAATRDPVRVLRTP